jgi:colicin import membrane protein
MQETRADNAQAIGLALLLHAVLFGLIFFGLWWTRSTTPPSAGEPVSAELFDPDSLSQSMRRELAQRPEPIAEPPPPPPAPEPEPLPEPLPEEIPPPPQPQAQEQLPVPDTVEQDEARRDAISDLTAEREQEERRRQEQIDLTERERQEEAEQKQKQSDMERERQRQIEDIRRQREQAEREIKQTEERLKQIADARARRASEAAAQADATASAPPPPGNQGVDPNLKGQYAAAIQEAILRNWTRPENVPIGQRCLVVIRQLPGGQVMDAQVDPSCPYDELGRRSVEAAVLKAQPLPYAGFEAVFERTLRLTFEAQDR